MGTSDERLHVLSMQSFTVIVNIVQSVSIYAAIQLNEMNPQATSGMSLNPTQGFWTSNKIFA